MAGHEFWTITGNLGRDVELRYTQSGKTVASFSVAVQTTWVDKASGERREKTKWIRVSVWDKLAEVCNEHLSKGSQVQCIGVAEASAYTDKDGKLQASLEMTAREVIFLGSRSNQQQGQSQQSQDLDDLPF